MKKTTLLIIVCGLYSLLCLAQPQQYSTWRLLDTGSGLSNNQIRGITQTENGLIVIKTSEQVNVYNGVTVQHFSYDRTRRYVWTYNRESHEYHDNQDRVWIKDLEHLALLNLRTGQYEYDIEKQLAAMGVNTRIKNFFIDNQKNYWFVTDGDDIVTYDVATRQTRTIIEGGGAIASRYGTLLEMSGYKNFRWLLFNSGILVCIDYVSGEVVTEEHYLMGKSSVRTSLHMDSMGNLWIAMGQCIYHYDRLGRRWDERYTISGRDNFFTCIDIDSNGNVWAGTSKSGVVTISSSNNAVTLTPQFNIPGYGRLYNDVHDIYCDNEGGVWVGTLFMGLCYYHPMMNRFQQASTSVSEHMITSENVRCFLCNPDGTMLVGSSLGIFHFDPKEGKMTRLFETAENDIVISLYRDSKGRVWAGTFLNSYYLIEGDVIRKSKLSHNPDANVGRAMYEDDEGRLWISTNAGIALYNDHTLEIDYLLVDKYPELGRHRVIQVLYPDSSGHGFTAVGLAGIFHYDTHTDKVSIPVWAEELEIHYDNLYCLLQDKRELIWIGTPEGLIVYDTRQQRKLEVLNTDKGLNNNNVVSLVATPTDDVWVGTDNGVSRIVVSEDDGRYQFHIQSYDKNDGIWSGKFYENAIYCTPEGILFFGGTNGLNYIDSGAVDAFTQSHRQPVFTSLLLFGQQVLTGETYQKRLILPDNICYTDEIELDYSQNNITLFFSTLNYSGNNHINYRYKLHGNDKDWTEGSANGLGQITYTGLQSGSYTLEVCTRTVTGEWTQLSATMDIRVLPPYWATWWAKTLYVLLLSVVVLLCYEIWQRRRKEILHRKAEEQRHQQQEELNQMKFRFFTNVSHEFRTPLTLIITPLEALLHRHTDARLQEQLKPIYTNAQRLLQLVNQLLDFRRLEMGGEHLNLKNGEIVRFINEICHSFKDMAEEKQVSLTFDSRVEHLYISFDGDKVYKIIGNLLSNAFKFTSAGGNISVDISIDSDERYVCITIKDTGQGISEEELYHIWKRFYQAEAQEKSPSIKGSGIGLHMVKEYVEMHQGHIDVESQLGDGTTFAVYLPTTLQTAQEETDGSDMLIQAIAESNNKYSILVVDDNDEFRHFMTGQLVAEGYNVIEAPDGIEAETMALKHNPDLVITDLMMPRRDGIELTQVLKANITISHIPVILLTAKVGDEAKIDAYRAGADDYIAKPFNYELLLLRIQQLIEKQHQRQERFRGNLDIAPSEVAVTSLDESLIRRAIETVEKYIADGEFGIEQLAAEVGLSKTHLNRKIQGIAGMTPLQFIRNIRLKRAAQLLRDSQYNISEIAYMTGFNTIKYFNKHFKEEFNMTPTQYREEYGTK